MVVEAVPAERDGGGPEPSRTLGTDAGAGHAHFDGADLPATVRGGVSGCGIDGVWWTVAGVRVHDVVVAIQRRSVGLIPSAVVGHQIGYVGSVCLRQLRKAALELKVSCCCQWKSSGDNARHSVGMPLHEHH